MPGPQLTPQVRSVLGRLRRSIRRYVLAEGAALVLLVLGLLFWLSMGLDWAYFQLSNYELPVWFRVGYGVVAVSLIAAGLLTWILMRTLRSMRTRALALVLEKRFPELGERLITAVEAAEGLDRDPSPLTAAMINRTVEQASRSAGRIRLGEVFARAPLRRALAGAVVVTASVLAFGLFQREALARWVRAFVQHDEVYWDRDTLLTVKVLAQPGDRIKEFDESGSYRHARGGDLVLLVEVPEENSRGKKLIVPERVFIEYRLEGGGTRQAPCTKLGERRFTCSFAAVMDPMVFWLTGGDFTSREPYRVELVDPPRVEKLLLVCDYPQHTRLNQSDALAVREVEGTQIALPAETRFLLRGETNKKILNVRIQYGRRELAFGWFEPAASGEEGGSPRDGGRVFRARMSVKTAEGDDVETRDLLQRRADPREFLLPGGRGFRVPFVLSAAATDAVRQRNARPLALVRRQGRAGETSIDYGGEFGPPFVMPPDSDVRIYLEDDDEIVSADPGRLTINGVRDAPPLVKAELRGIGNSITQRATIPVAADVSDDFGIADVKFQYAFNPGTTAVEAARRARESFSTTGDRGSNPKASGGRGKKLPTPSWQSWPLVNSPADYPQEFALGRGPGEPFERFDLSEVRIRGENGELRRPRPGDRLALAVVAEDGDRLNGPGIGRSAPEFTFNVVSDQELLGALYGRELQLLLRFRAIIREVEETRKEFQTRIADLQERDRLRQDGPPDEQSARRQRIANINTNVAATANRGMLQVLKNHGESRTIEAAFRDIRDELHNNKIVADFQRLDEGIIGALHRVNEDPAAAEPDDNFPGLNRATELYKAAVEERVDPVDALEECARRADLLLERMRAILGEIEELVEFHDAVQKLEAIIKEQEQLKDATDEERKKSILKKLDKLKELGIEPK